MGYGYEVITINDAKIQRFQFKNSLLWDNNGQCSLTTSIVITLSMHL